MRTAASPRRVDARRSATSHSARSLASTLAMLGLLGVTPLARADEPVTPAAPQQQSPPPTTEQPQSPPVETPAPSAAPSPEYPPAPQPWPPVWPPKVAASRTPSPVPTGAVPTASNANKPIAPSTPVSVNGQSGDLTGQNGSGIVRQYAGNSADKWLGPWAKNLYISGGTSLTSRSFSVEGSDAAKEQYEQQNNSLFYGTRQIGPFQQNMDLTIQGKVFDMFDVNARITNTRQGNYFNQVFGFNYKKSGTEVSVGDVNAALPGNEFVTFARTLRGLTFGRDFGSGMRLQGLASLTQAVTRRGNFQGTGTSGPYPLNASSIIEGTEKVRLNGRDIQRGTDYTIDYLLGQIQFQGGLIVNPEDTVEYSYEAQNFNSTPGILGGLRWEMPLGGKSQFGVTYLQQKSTSGQRGVNELVERFAVDPDIGRAYQLASLIEPNSPVEVRFLEQILKENVDYQLNRDLRFFRLLKKLPPDLAENATLSLSVRYIPVRQSSIGSDKAVFGFDGSTKLNQNIDLNFQLGQSNGETSQSGSALSLGAAFRSKLFNRDGAITGSIGFRDIGAGYSSIDSVAGAFLRAEKGLRGNLSINPTPYLQITTSMNQSKLATNTGTSATGGTATDASSLIWTNNDNFNFGFALSLANLPKIDFSHTQTTQKTDTATSSSSRFSSQMLNLNWQKGIFGMSASFGRNSSKGRSVFSTGYTNDLNSGTPSGVFLDDYTNGYYGSTQTDSSSNNSRFRLSVNPARWISIVGALGFSKTKYGSTSLNGDSGSSTDARDASLGVSLPLNDRMAFTLNYQESSNGRTALQSNQQTDENGNPIPGSQLDYGISGQKARTYSLNAHYIPWDALDLNLDLSRSLQLIPGYDNTNNDTISLTANYAPHSRINLLGNFVDQRVSYLGNQQGDSNNRSYQLTATAGPFGKITYTFSYQFMNTGSALYNFGTGNNNGGIPGIGDNLRSRQQTGLGTNYFAQQQDLTIWSLRADYPIATNRSLFLQWQTLDAKSPLASDSSSNYYTAGNYRRGAGTVGLEFRLSELIGLTFDLNLIDMTDRERPDMSYKARALNMDLSARF